MQVRIRDDQAYGSTATCMPTPLGSSFVAVAANVGSLAPGTTYHFRVWAKNANATPALGADATFTTAIKLSEGFSGGEELGEGAGPPQATTSSTPPPSGGVKGSHEVAPNATVAGNAATVGANGAFSLEISCPAGAGACTGSVVVKTAGAVAASAHASLAALVASALREAGGAARAVGHAAARRSIVTLTRGSFSVAAGHSKPVALRLSAKARRLLAKLHVLRAKATITARNPSGATHTSVKSLVLKVKKKR